MSVLLWIVAVVWFALFSVVCLAACDQYNKTHVDRSGAAGFILWVFLAVIPAILFACLA
ncbi:hypothetical protein mellemsur_30 [Escherichia phage mellemsur]|uniref:Uncharacterized protein n=1 Tax=Escherichia phage mellemsur TaxID=2696418 RepID=A0A6B9WMZ7_9CAUD|nr:hypothetical protein [Enterobacter bugandensis]QHR65431.1 hypothetical protein mellemsur_30 [Escherichia phage mellemsur]